MLIEDFKRALTAFADSPAEVDISRGNLLVQVRDELISASLSQQAGELMVVEAGDALPAHRWLLNRVARLPLLADRILSYVPPTPDFVAPSGTLLDQLDIEPSGATIGALKADSTALEVLGRRPAGTTSVLYLTSDAGEGKTTLINQLARHQALELKAKRSDWLLVPIPLGGRGFLRFDDVTVAALVNRLRFQLLYYDAFIELVRLGALVPAFDGFEEMIVSSSSGEAISALGNLVSKLASSGSVLIAARKAYFDYPSFKAQARLFDAIGRDTVSFARLSLDRWDKVHFLEYASKRGLPLPEQTYEAVAQRLSPDHPLLTRAVLVRQLIKVAEDSSDLSDLITKIGHSPQEYFFQFVNALIEREAHDKWIDLSGDPHEPLLSVEEHHELLSMVAQEMWLSTTDMLRIDVLDTIAVIFAESARKRPDICRQVSDRLRSHSLIVESNVAGGRAFDHEDFRAFYLGEALGRLIRTGATTDLASLLEVGVLPATSSEEALCHTRRLHFADEMLVAELQRLADGGDRFSHLRENCGAIALATADNRMPLTLRNMAFPEDALRARHFHQLTVTDCHFHGTSLATTEMSGCRFVKCNFERLEVPAGARLDATFENCTVAMVVREDRDGEQLFDPQQIARYLHAIGITVRNGEPSPGQRPGPAAEPTEASVDLWLVERVMRLFLRNNRVNENMVRARLGIHASTFINELLPRLLSRGVLEESDYAGHGTQRRFKMGLRMQAFHDALASCGGDLERFLVLAGTARDTR